MRHPLIADSNGTCSDAQALASELAPVLAEACRGRLGAIEWFRSTWQQGGAATGYSTWVNGDTHPVIIKLPVGFNEHHWTTALSAADCPHTPRVLAHGQSLGPYDLGWLVLERLQGRTLGNNLEKECVLGLLDAACDLHVRALQIRPATTKDRPEPPDWSHLIERARASVRDNHIDHEQRWNEVLKKVQKHLDQVVSEWRVRPINTWCHGDLHPGNAMYRGPGERTGPIVLIDLALMHAGHWVEDAVYLERLYWGHEQLLHGVKPVSALAKLRRQRGLETGDDYAHLADLRRLMMAACVPTFLAREGNPVYVEAALGIAERLTKSLF